MRWSFTRLLSITAILIVLGGCASTQREVSQAAALGDAGVALTDTLPKLYDAFFLLAVEVDSLDLEQSRSTARDSEQLLEKLEKSNADFRELNTTLTDLKRHALLLRSYFVAFRALAADETGGEIPGAAKKAVETLSSVGAQLNGKPFLDQNIGALIEPAAAFAVTLAKAAALRAEFEARGADIDREISIQESAIGIISQRIIADRERILIETIENPLTEEFALDFNRPLADNWWRRRADYLKMVVEVDEVNKAQSAVRNLRIAWEDMAAGREQAATIEDIMADLSAVTAFTEKLAALKE